MRPIETEKITFFQKHLLSWYKKNRRNYYWRTPRLTTYQYIIAEVLLQRTKADTIANFYPDFISEFPNWQSLANARLDTIETFLKPVGLYKQKAMRLQNLAKEMVKRNGRLPKK